MLSVKSSSMAYGWTQAITFQTVTLLLHPYLQIS